MDATLRALLQEIERAGRAHDERETDRARKMLNLDPETAQLVSLLVQLGKRRSVLEVGTSSGYSTIWLAWSVGERGRVWSIDREPGKHALADRNLRRAGLRDRVELVLGDATEAVARLAGPFDCVFFDADRLSAPAQLALLEGKLTADVLLLADNALSHPDEIAGYLRAVEALPGVEHAVIPVGKGLSVAYRAECGEPPGLSGIKPPARNPGGPTHLASDTQMISLSFRMYAQRFAKAGCDQTTSRPKPWLVGSSRWARLTSS